MNWTFLLSEHTRQTISALPFEAQFALFDLVEALEVDPFAVSEPYGIDDKVTREASFGDYGVLVMYVNPLTMRITPLSFTWAG